MGKPAERPITRITRPAPVLEGAGVIVKRGLPSAEVPYEEIDPFLLLDEVDLPPSGEPAFPRHPHRGFEIVTYLLSGAISHGDDFGNRTVIRGGGLQKITAGKGIWHEEMPIAGGREAVRGLQLWINLSRKDKGAPPDYQILEPEAVPVVEQPRWRVRVLVGERSPIRLYTPALYLDVTVAEKAAFSWELPQGHQGFVYVLQGRGSFGANAVEGEEGQLLVLGPGQRLKLVSNSGPLRFVLAAARPHREPIRWSGPFVD